MPDVRDSTVGQSGIVERSIRLLGENGASAAGIGQWFRVHAYWKTFMLYTQDRLQATSLGSASVEIHGAMELPDSNEDLASYELLGTLNSGSKSLSLEAPWRYVRAQVKTAAASGAIQVGLAAQDAG